MTARTAHPVVGRAPRSRWLTPRAVVGWFARRGIDEDPEEVFADLLSAAFS